MIAQASPTTTAFTLLHKVSASNLYVAAIHCCNPTENTAYVSVALAPKEATEPSKSWVAFKVMVRPSETFSMGGGELPTGSSVFIMTSEVGVIFTLTGQAV